MYGIVHAVHMSTIKRGEFTLIMISVFANRQSGIRLVTATLGNFVNLNIVWDIASQPWSVNQFYVNNYTLVSALKPQLVSATCDGK